MMYNSSTFLVTLLMIFSVPLNAMHDAALGKQIKRITTRESISRTLRSFNHAPLIACYNRTVYKPNIAIQTLLEHVQHNPWAFKHLVRNLDQQTQNDCLGFALENGDSKRALLLLKTLKNYQSIQHTVRVLRSPKYIGKTPICLVKEAFYKKKSLSEDDLQLYKYVENQLIEHSKEYQQNLQTTLQFSKHLNDFPTSALQLLTEYLQPDNPFNKRRIYADFQKAIDNNNSWQVAEFLAGGCSLDTRDNQGHSPFERAIIFNKLNCIVAMINHGIPGLEQNIQKYIDLAHKNDHPHIVAYFDNHVLPKLRSQSQDFAKECRTNSKTDNILKSLHHGTDPNTKEVSIKDFPLTWTVDHQKEHHIGLLLSLKADPNTQLANGNPLLTCATNHDNSDITRLLLEHKANPNAKTTNGNPLLTHVMRCKTPGHLEQMLAFKADINAKNIDNDPMLLTAINTEKVAVVKLMLDHKANPNIPLSNKNPLLVASTNGANSDITRLLLEYNADPNAKTIGGNPLLVHVLINKSPENLTLMLNHKADPNAKLKDGRPLLMFAIQSFNASAVKALCKAGARVHDTYDELSPLVATEYLRPTTSEQRIAQYAIRKILKRSGAKRTWLDAIFIFLNSFSKP